MPRRVALVIGNSTYKESPLKNPAADARAISKSLESVGFEVITQLDRSKFEMEADIDALTEGLHAGDAVLFFYAGHGLELDNANFLVPVEASIKRKHHITQRCVRADYVTEAMEDSGASLRIVVLDACRNNPFRGFTRSGKSGLASMHAPEGTIIAYSTAPGTEAADGEGENSPFAQHFVETLGVEHPLGLEITELFRKVARQVKKDTGQRAYLNYDASMDRYLVKQPSELVAEKATPKTPKTAPTIADKRKEIELLLKDESDPDDYYRKQDIKTIRAHADLGIPAAQAQLGFMYLGNKGIPKELDNAVRWTRKAAKQNNSRALNNLGYMYETAVGVPKDLNAAVKHYRQAVAQGSAKGYRNMAVAYENGNGVEKNEQEAVRLYHKAADGGDIDSQYKLGHMYDTGQFDVPVDVSKAIKWYQKAADQEHAEAQYSLGRMCVLGRGTKVNKKTAAAWYLRAAKQGYSEAQFRVGRMYMVGEGVGKDLEEAEKWLKKAADQGNAGAKEDLRKLNPPVAA